MARFLCYALGGGLGHLTRQLGLARAARAAGHRVSVLCNGPLIRLVLPEMQRLGIDIVHLGDEPRALDVAVRVHDYLREAVFDLLVVDTFPRGLVGELEPWLQGPTPRAWVHRSLRDNYAQHPDVVRAAMGYQAILLPGEAGPLAHLPQAHWTSPWLLLPHDQWLSRDEARAALGVEGARPLVLVMGTGTPAEAAESGALGRLLGSHLGERAQVRVTVPGDGLHPWPLLRYMAGVDVLVGAGGYNTVHEARATGTPLVAFARPRRYDLQRERLSEDEHVGGVEALCDRVEACLRRGEAVRRIDPRDGAVEAVAHLETLL